MASKFGIHPVCYDLTLLHISCADFCIRLSQRHTGKHLAQVTADCVMRFGLEDKVSLDQVQMFP